MSGEDALNKVKKESYDLILLDLMLSGVDGLEVCKVLKQDNQDSLINLAAEFENRKSQIQSILWIADCSEKEIKMSMTFASTFLSHSSVDKLLVQAVAQELGRRGIITWLDKDELSPGASLTQALTQAIKEHTTVTLFLSRSSIKSSWVNDELSIALKLDNQRDKKDSIIPVYLGDPLELVSSHKLLKNRWLHADGDRVDRLGILSEFDTDPEQRAVQIAKDIADRIYKRLNFVNERDIIVYLDQRGEGPRIGIPEEIPKNVRLLKGAALVFRPSLGSRSKYETLHGTEFKSVKDTMLESLREALGGVRWHTRKNIRIYGSSQLGFPFILGTHFDRNTSADLFCTNVVDGNTFSNKNQLRATPLQGGNPDCESSHPSIQPIEQGESVNAVSLVLSIERYVKQVYRYLEVHSGSPRLVWVKSGVFNDNKQVMDYIADVVELLTRLRDYHDVNTVHIYCGLPFSIVPILAANLLHVVDNVKFMEFRRDLQNQSPTPGEMYTPL